MPFETLSRQQREAAIRTLFRGRRLAFEVGLNEDWFNSAALTFQDARGRWQQDYWLYHEYPATLVVLLASAGSLYYRKVPSLWAHVGVTGNGTALVGQSFLHALRTLRLETFENLVEAESALTYITPILAHGGVPAYCLPDFFRLLDKGAGMSTEAAELIQLWKTRPQLTAGIDRPVARFLTYGGVPARDFLQRAIDFHLEADATLKSPSPDEAGLPAPLVDAYWTWLDDPETATRDKGAKVPRPVLKLDPWDALGPTIDLPVTAAPATWKVRDQRYTWVCQGSRTFGHTIRLNPAQRWEVEFTEVNQKPRTFPFEGLERHGAVFFEPANSKLWRDQDQLRLASVWVLHDKDLTLTILGPDGDERAPATVEELPQPIGAWGSCRLAYVDLTGVRTLLLKQRGTARGQIRVAPQTSRPSIADAPLQYLRTATGAPVFSAFPSLALPALADVDAKRWRVSVRCGGEARHEHAGNLPARQDGTLGLEVLLADWAARDVELAVRGPLGADLRTSLCVLPGLTLRMPEHVLGPRDTGEFRLTAAANVGLGSRGTAALVVPARESTTVVDVPVRCGPSENVLRIAVPRVRWSLCSASHAEVTTDVRRIDVHASELTADGKAPVLLVDAGMADVGLRLRLSSGPDTLQEAEWVRTSRSGRHAFPLSAFFGTITQSGRSTFEFVVDIQRLNVSVIRLRSQLAATNLSATRRIDGSDVVVACSIHDDGPARPRDIRFWSVDRPWAEPLVAPLPEGLSGHISFDATLPISPGRYLMEVGLSDPWNSPVRPRPRDANTVGVTLGTPEELEAHRRGLDAKRPLHALELATSAGSPLPALPWEDVRAMATEALHAISVQVRASGHRAVQSRAVASLVQCVAATPARLAWASARLLEQGQVTPSDVLLTTIAVVGARVDGTLEPDCEVTVTDSMARDLWNSCPPLAALHDVPRARAGYDDSRERCLDFLGCVAPAPFTGGPTIGVPEWGLSLDQLRNIQPLLELRAGKLLDIDAGIDATFEWLIAERDGRVRSSRWCQAHTLDDGALLLCEACKEAVLGHLTARKPAQLTDYGQKLPRRLLKGALHLVQGTRETGRAAEALLELCDVVPKMIVRDLTAAIYLLSGCAAEAPTTELADSDAEPA